MAGADEQLAPLGFRRGQWRHLRLLEQRYGLDAAADTALQTDMLCRDGIEAALARAQVALLMVSADFLDSDFLTREKLPPLFDAAREEGLRIL